MIILAKKVHVNQHLTSRKIIEILEKNPDLEKITCPPSIYNRIPSKYLEALKKLNIKVEPLHGRARKYTEKDVKLIRKLLSEGKTPKEIAGITKIPLKSIYYLKGDMKLKRGPKPKYDKSTRIKVQKMASNGMSPKKIAEKFNIPLRTVYYIIKKG